ncbi:MAG TPA: hypothetical protein VNT81_16675 [Vicinamibacterales bacterium]|nr:hypothetical protein [Vicinamibacterales bacterium]
MLRTNLSTRPFYNARAVRAALGALGAVAVALTLFNTYEILRLRAQNSDARTTIASNDAQARAMREQAQEVRRAIDRSKLAAVQAAANEANSLIDRRTFSWTELLNQFQATLPADVRIAGVQPQIDSEGRRMVQITVFSRRIEDLEQFMDALDKTGMFAGVMSRADRPDAAGGLQSDLQAYYAPAAVRAAPASESGKAAPGNQTPANVSAGVAR